MGLGSTRQARTATKGAQDHRKSEDLPKTCEGKATRYILWFLRTLQFQSIPFRLLRARGFLVPEALFLLWVFLRLMGSQPRPSLLFMILFLLKDINKSKSKGKFVKYLLSQSFFLIFDIPIIYLSHRHFSCCSLISQKV